jgi:hypothetical protein
MSICFYIFLTNNFSELLNVQQEVLPNSTAQLKHRQVHRNKQNCN